MKGIFYKIPLTIGAAFFLAGCSSQSQGDSTEYCVNDKDEVVDSKLCDEGKASNGGVMPVLFPYHYYYMGGINNHAVGSHLTGGSPSAPSTGKVSSPAARGGFGSSAGSHSSGS